jgi:hypothetical protein
MKYFIIALKWFFACYFYLIQNNYNLLILNCLNDRRK